MTHTLFLSFFYVFFLKRQDSKFLEIRLQVPRKYDTKRLTRLLCFCIIILHENQHFSSCSYHAEKWNNNPGAIWDYVQQYCCSPVIVIDVVLTTTKRRAEEKVQDCFGPRHCRYHESKHYGQSCFSSNML